MLYDQISKIIDMSICDSKRTYKNFLKRLGESSFTRDENPQTHFCAYFLPYNVESNKVFIVHHKKSDLWLSPGGHIDNGEGLLDALNREIYEELGVKQFFQKAPSPFLLTITPIENKGQPCKTHFDIWYLVNTDGANFNVDPEEFHDTKWLTIDEAEKIVTDQPNRKALEIVKKI
ncbi:MAG: NUDIX domain-containing protein [Patescibacteria group bacterium]